MLTGLSVSVFNHRLKQENYSDNGLRSTQATFSDCVSTTNLTAGVINLWSNRLRYAAHGHICKMYIYCKKLHTSRGLGIKCVVDFICAAHEPAHNNGFTPSAKKKKLGTPVLQCHSTLCCRV